MYISFIPYSGFSIFTSLAATHAMLLVLINTAFGLNCKLHHSAGVAMPVQFRVTMFGSSGKLSPV